MSLQPFARGTFPREVLTTGEVAELISGCSPKAPTGIRNRALVWLLYRSGLRVSEALALRPADADLTRHALRVLQARATRPPPAAFIYPPPAPSPADSTPARPSACAAAPCSAPCPVGRCPTATSATSCITSPTRPTSPWVAGPALAGIVVDQMRSRSASRRTFSVLCSCPAVAVGVLAVRQLVRENTISQIPPNTATTPIRRVE
jgi:hypothetical protein